MSQAMDAATRFMKRENYTSCFTWSWDGKEHASNVRVLTRVEGQWLLSGDGNVMLGSGAHNPPLKTIKGIRGGGDKWKVYSEKSAWVLPPKAVREVTSMGQVFVVCDILSVFRVRLGTALRDVLGCWGCARDGVENAIFMPYAVPSVITGDFTTTRMDVLFEEAPMTATSPGYSRTSVVAAKPSRPPDDQYDLEEKPVREEITRVSGEIEETEDGFYRPGDAPPGEDPDEFEKETNKLLDAQRKTITKLSDEIKGLKEELTKVHVPREVTTVLKEGVWTKVVRPLSGQDLLDEQRAEGLRLVARLKEESTKNVKKDKKGRFIFEGDFTKTLEHVKTLKAAEPTTTEHGEEENAEPE